LHRRTRSGEGPPRSARAARRRQRDLAAARVGRPQAPRDLWWWITLARACTGGAREGS
jgi:hypothetical protein